MSRFPQYAKSTDPEVIAAVQQNLDGLREWKDRAVAFAEKHGAPKGAFYPRTFAGRYSIYALATKEAPTTGGRWKRMRRGWAPYRNNPVAKDMDAIRFDKAAVPGLPALVYSAYDADGRHWMMSPAPFLHDGAVWVGFDHVPVSGDGECFGEQWVECLASEYHAAAEAVSQ